MNITINTDASFKSDGKLKAAGYAFWITSNLERIKKWGVLKEAFDPHTSECYCVGNALHTVLFTYKNIDNLFINTDSKSTIRNLQKNKKDIKKCHHPCYLEVWNLIQKIKQKNKNCKIIFRHVKAHSHTNTKRNWVNDWCDKMSKLACRQEYIELQKSKKNRIKPSNITI